MEIKKEVKGFIREIKKRGYKIKNRYQEFNDFLIYCNSSDIISSIDLYYIVKKTDELGLGCYLKSSGYLVVYNIIKE